MRITRLVWKELWYRKVGALVILLGITLCVALIVSFQRISLGAIDEMRRAMKVMGKNIVILPEGVSLEQYWAGDFGDKTFPEEAVQKVADYSSRGALIARHFLGSLQREVRIHGKEVVLSGIMIKIDPFAPKAVTYGARKQPRRGEAELGYRAARRLGLKKGDTFTVGTPPRQKTFRVLGVLKEQGTVHDYKVFVHIRDAQELFGTGRVVNVIEALSCLCARQNLPALAEKIEKALFSGKKGKPLGRAYHFWALAKARRDARQESMEDLNLLTAIVGAFGLLVIGGYSAMNARERRKELGILLAVAARPRHAAALLLLKMLFLGVVGVALGCLLAEGLLRLYELPAFKALHPAMRPYILKLVGWQLYAFAAGLVVVLVLLPSLVGVVLAARTDPAETLREL